jgi:anthranilate phosphoribosyltransferase
MVVHSDDGLDEISAAAASHVAEVKDGAVHEYDISPEQMGQARTTLEGLEVSGADESLALIRAALSGAPGEKAGRARQVVALNAGAALYVAGLERNLTEGVEAAARLLDSGKPWARIEALADYTAGL